MPYIIAERIALRRASCSFAWHNTVAWLQITIRVVIKATRKPMFNPMTLKTIKIAKTRP